MDHFDIKMMTIFQNSKSVPSLRAQAIDIDPDGYPEFVELPHSLRTRAPEQENLDVLPKSHSCNSRKKCARGSSSKRTR